MRCELHVLTSIKKTLKVERQILQYVMSHHAAQEDHCYRVRLYQAHHGLKVDVPPTTTDLPTSRRMSKSPLIRNSTYFVEGQG